MTEIRTAQKLRKLYLTDIMNMMSTQKEFEEIIDSKLSVFFSNFFRIMVEEILINNKIVYLTKAESSVYFKLERIERDQVIIFKKCGAYKKADLISQPYAYAIFAYYQYGNVTKRRLLSSYIITNEILIRMKKKQNFKNPEPLYFDANDFLLNDKCMFYHMKNEKNIKEYSSRLNRVFKYIINENYMVSIKCIIFGVKTYVRMGIMESDETCSGARSKTRARLIGIRHKNDNTLDSDIIQYFGISNTNYNKSFINNKLIEKSISILLYNHIEDLFYRRNKIHIFAIKSRSSTNRLVKINITREDEIDYLFYKHDYTYRLPQKININL